MYLCIDTYYTMYPTLVQIRWIRIVHVGLQAANLVEDVERVVPNDFLNDPRREVRETGAYSVGAPLRKQNLHGRTAFLTL